MDSVGGRIQRLGFIEQVTVLARLAQGRSSSDGFSPADLTALFTELRLPPPAKVTNQLAALVDRGCLVRVGQRPPWFSLTPLGRECSTELAADMDLAALAAESARGGLVSLGDTPHPEIPPSLAPPELVLPLHEFFNDYSFETNVFAMTRFPDSAGENLDPIAPALDAAREACALHGLAFHLASDRKIVDDLWPNVLAHIWGSRYGIAFFETRTGPTLNYNLQIEVGSCLALGRRLAILKDRPLAKLPSDLVGRVYHEVDLSQPGTVAVELHRWIRDDLRLGSCSQCAGA